MQRVRRLGLRGREWLVIAISAMLVMATATTASAANEVYQYTFSFVNGQTITGSSPDKTAFIANAGGSSASNPAGMTVHLSCSDQFTGGWGEKDGPVQGVDTAWQLNSFEINKLKDGKIDKTCSGSDLTTTPPSGDYIQYTFNFVNGQTITGTSENNTAFLPNAGGPSADNPTGMNVHVSCSDEFPGGWGEKDGPDQNVDTAWQLNSFEINKIKDGKIDKTCSGNFGPPTPVGTPAIDIEKFVNGFDADTPPGPTVTVGDTVVFDYVVTNTGEVPLREVAVVDTTLGAVTCPSTTLDVGASMECDPNSEVVTAPGPMFMEANVTGVGDTGAPGITDPIPASGQGRLYSFTFLNGITISGQAPDNNTFFLPNAGGSSVENPTGMDVHLSCSDKFPGGWGEKDGPDQNVDTAWQLASYEIIKFKDGTVDKVCGDSLFPVSQTVTDTDPVNFVAVVPANPAIDIEKYVNGFDADTPPGPTFTVGETVTFTYVVTNTGNTPLTNVQVIDSTLGPVTCPTSNLAVGETIDCGPNTEVVIEAGAMFMEATVTGDDPNGTEVTDTDPVNFVVVKKAVPAIDLEKYVNGEDADLPLGPTVYVGDTVVFNYYVTNTGNTPLTNIELIDDTLGPITCPMTSLAVGETMDCGPVYKVVTEPGQVSMYSTVTGDDPNGTQVSDTDPVKFVVVDAAPHIDVESYVNWNDADWSPGPTFKLGDSLEFQYYVENTGGVTLANIEVVDDLFGPISCPETTLAPGESMWCDSIVIVADKVGAAYVLTTVTAHDPNGTEVTDTDPVYGTISDQQH
jgi:uncharacterized repeat protein (TIGR01451 family)